MRSGTLSILCLLVSLPVGAQPRAAEIVKRSLDLQDRNFERSRDYTYQQHEVVTETDGSGAAKSTKTRTYDVLRLYGRPYNRLIEKDGKPLSASENEKQEERLRTEMEKRRRQADDPASKERREYEKDRAEQKKLFQQVGEAFDFTLIGEESVSGKPAWLIEAEPRSSFKPRDRASGILARMRGKLWIDQAEYQWVKIEAETTDTISFGLILARLSRGSTFRFEQKRVNDEVWLPSRVNIGIDGRLALLKKLRAGVDIRFSNYRKFQTDSRVVSTDADPRREQE